MKLYLLRHGIAGEYRPGADDRLRPLTPEGIREMEAAARGMKALSLRLDAVITSPLVRARQTAEIAAAALDLLPVLREDPRLAGGGYFGLSELLAALAAEHRVLLVGHEPDMSSVIGTLTGGSVRMKKASLALVDLPAVQPGRGELRWLLEAEHLCRIGGA